MRIVAVLLAAGGGSRFVGSTHKLLAPLDGRPVVQHAIDHVVASDVGHVTIVTGAVEFGELPEGVTRVHNAHWHDGQATSVALGLAVADELGADAVILGLADQPFVPVDAWRLVAGASPEHQIVVASYDGRRGPHPVRLHRSLWALLPVTGDDGARTLIRAHPALVHEVPCPGSAADIDTVEDLHRWTNS